MDMGCGMVSSGELGTEESDRRLAVSGSMSDTEPFLFFFLLENALLNELRSC